MSDTVTIFEVGPRDGLQNESNLVPAAQKIALIDLLSRSGLRQIEATSFVSPKWVPQMADAAEVMAGISRVDDVTYSVLTPNMRGLTAALEARADSAAIFGAASESFSQKNINCSIKESLARFRPVSEAALSAGIGLRGYVSCVVACPYEGTIQPDAVRDVALQMLDMGCHEISLGDTIGKGGSDDIRRLLDVVARDIDGALLAGHYHDTDGNALVNVEASLDYGLRVFDSAIGGLGGCPYAPGAKGNLSTLSLFDMLSDKGWDTGLDRDALIQAEQFIATAIASEKEQ
ncbi:hydroxymethylglutaryl-CoA lyase [Amylibacter marinus]|uniref:Hydroxymethylglutaryl-CoA lyase n=1 Tax=Amylibacter marinus TaxID=1475483 RepID=A0ABQ5VVS7_9RHOB|nr:hydroxymethylglutaryl-CoA lyase [Amylibacter marinus]GLQ35316.1 hydroxymethylglutaryl-CoA lyase [Amylibacter marinus]